jgi:Flp pilus assembly protein TadB
MKTFLIVAGLLLAPCWLWLAVSLTRRRWRERCRNLELDIAKGGESVPARMSEEFERRGPPLGMWAWGFIDSAEMLFVVAILPGMAVWSVYVAACVQSTRTVVIALCLVLYASWLLGSSLRRIRRNQRTASDAALHVFGEAYAAATPEQRDRMEQVALRLLYGVGQDGLPRE